MNMQFTKTVLYFLPGAVASDKDREIAKRIMIKLEATVKFRNGTVDAGGGNPEKCDFVYGADIKGENGNVVGSSIPAEYATRYKVVDASGEIISEPPAFTPTAPEATPNPPVDENLAALVGTVNKGWG